MPSYKCPKEESYHMIGCGKKIDGVYKDRRCKTCEYNEFEVFRKRK